MNIFELPEETKVVVQTLNSTYEITTKKDNKITILGGTKPNFESRYPTETEANLIGCVSSQCLKFDCIELGTKLVFKVKEDTIYTSEILGLKLLNFPKLKESTN